MDKMRAEKAPPKTGSWSLGMTVAIFLVLQIDAAASVIPNQIVSMGATPVIWGIGAAVLFRKITRKNAESPLYCSSPFSQRDALVLFFVITCGIAIAASNYLYAELKPLLVRELFTSYPLYNIRNAIYYPLEVLLMLELLICGQKTGEAFTGKALPWGAFTLFLLWGLPHILWHGALDGLVSAFRAFLYAAPFYASRRNIKTSYLSMLVLWFL